MSASSRAKAGAQISQVMGAKRLDLSGTHEALSGSGCSREKVALSREGMALFVVTGRECTTLKESATVGRICANNILRQDSTLKENV